MLEEKWQVVKGFDIFFDDNLTLYLLHKHYMITYKHTQRTSKVAASLCLLPTHFGLTLSIWLQ